MTLVVENGGGVPGAESYASVEVIDTFWAKRGGNVAWAAATEPAKEAAARLATDFIDVHFLSRTSPYYEGQGLAWPTDEGYSIPQLYALRKAVSYVAPSSLAGPLVGQVVSSEPFVTERTERVEGVVSETIKYAMPGGETLTISGRDLGFLQDLLRSFSGSGVGRRIT